MGIARGRILCPDEQLADVLPYFTGYEVLGGGMTRVSPLPHKWAGCVGGLFLRQGATNVTADALGEYLKAYNVAYAIMPAQWTGSRLLQVPGGVICYQSPEYVV